MATTSTPLRLLAAAVATAALLTTATGCAAVHRQVGDAWSVTYRVDVDGPTGTGLTKVSVEGAERRGDAPTTVELGSERTTSARGDASSWKTDRIVLAEDDASVRATPPAGRTATCHVLLDGKRDIASATSSRPGAPVRCSVRTPAFDG